MTGSASQSVEVICDNGYLGGGTWTCGSDGSFTGTACNYGPDTCTCTQYWFGGKCNDCSSGEIWDGTGSCVAKPTCSEANQIVGIECPFACSTCDGDKVANSDNNACVDPPANAADGGTPADSGSAVDGGPNDGGPGGSGNAASGDNGAVE